MSSRPTQILALVGVAVAAAFAVAVGLTLLGGSDDATSRENYQAAIVRARDRVDFAYGQIAASTSPEDLAERIEAAGVVVGSVASDLDETGVAEGFEDEHVRLVRRLRGFSDALAGTAAEIRDPTFAGVLPGITSLSFPEWDAINRILAELDEQGIDVDQLGRH